MSWVAIIFFSETGLCLAIQMVNLVLLYRVKHKTATDLLAVHLTCVQTMLCATNVVLFKNLKVGQTRVEFSLCASLNLVQVLIFVTITIDRVVAVKQADRYTRVLQTRKMARILMLIWGMSIFYGAVQMGFNDSKSAYRILITCDAALLALFVFGYTYVVFKVNFSRVDTPYCAQMWSVIIYLYFSFLTTLAVFFGFTISHVHYLVWTLTYLLVAMVYSCVLKTACHVYQQAV